MNIRERAEVELGIQNVDAFTASFGSKCPDAMQALPKEEFEPAQAAFTEAFEDAAGLTQIDPSKFFIARVKDRVVRREYYRPTPQDEDSFRFAPQALCEVGIIKGRFGVNIEWRHDANFRRDSLTVFPFDDEMKLRLKPGEELSVDWKQGLVSSIELKTHKVENGKPQLHNAFATLNMFGDAQNKGNVNYWKSNWERRFQRVIDLDYLRANPRTRDEMDKSMEIMARTDTGLGDYPYTPINLLHLERNLDDGEITINQINVNSEDANSETGITIERFDSPEREELLDSIFIPEPFNPLALIATIFQRNMLNQPENSPLAYDREWLNQHSIVRELIELKWIRHDIDPLRKFSQTSSDSL
ncbi:MAG: hypothetical protein CO136_02495 [Candidatus Levybacteria bacterium CG_4_9_14_3_um_filter_36_7]|nr:MAG: hypothetical protein AUK12_00420 [Candidatus Levybacteria bacterium CG2_30_37_29]PJA90351.1 MAG: hypothetical protein CO136_02495 [Candidatus Levybacteria bacterium CG_4_9_14_3_um_filter_36_7]